MYIRVVGLQSEICTHDPCLSINIIMIIAIPDYHLQQNMHDINYQFTIHLFHQSPIPNMHTHTRTHARTHTHTHTHTHTQTNINTTLSCTVGCLLFVQNVLPSLKYSLFYQTIVLLSCMLPPIPEGNITMMTHKQECHSIPICHHDQKFVHVRYF